MENGPPRHLDIVVLTRKVSPGWEGGYTRVVALAHGDNHARSMFAKFRPEYAREVLNPNLWTAQVIGTTHQACMRKPQIISAEGVFP